MLWFFTYPCLSSFFFLSGSASRVRPRIPWASTTTPTRPDSFTLPSITPSRSSELKTASNTSSSSHNGKRTTAPGKVSYSSALQSAAAAAASAAAAAAVTASATAAAETDTSLTACLKYFTASETLQDYRCSTCHDCNVATKRFLIHRPPKVLLLTLKRFARTR